MRNNNNDDYFEATRRGSRVGTSNDSESLELLGEGSGSYGSAEPLERGTSNSSSEPYQSSEKLRPYVRKIIEFSVVAECLMAFYIPLWFSMMFEGRVQPHLVAAVVVAVFNLFGCFCEGIGKVLEEDAWLESAKIASLTSKYSTGLRGGFLTVITSFPDIAECGKDMVNWSKIIVIGIVYCWGVMIFGTYLYRQGRFYAKTRRKDLTKTLLAIGPSSTQLCIGVVLLSVIFAVWNPSFLKIGAAKRPQGQTGFTFGFWTPELKELIAGMIFSAGGALCSFYLSEVLTDKPVLGRFITNIVSIAMVVFVRFIYYLAPSTVQSVVLAKFSTSFCGAASSFSGTIGDVHDAWSSPDSAQGPENKQRQKHRVRSKVSAIQNFGVHLILTVLLMAFAFWFTTRPSPILLPPKSIHWVAEQNGNTEWGGVGDTTAIIGGRKQSR